VLKRNRVITSTWTDTASIIVTLKVSGDPKLIRVVIPGRERREMERWRFLIALSFVVSYAESV